MNRVARRARCLITDLVAVLMFAAIGRRSHGEDLGGLLVTWWPFAAGTFAAHLVLAVVRRPSRTLDGGAWVVASTVVVGMTLRVLVGQGTAVSFIVVATLVLTLMLVGWRWVVRWLTARGVYRRAETRR